MLRKQVLPDRPVSPEHSETYEYLQQHSAIILRPFPDQPTRFIPTIPLIALPLNVEHALHLSDPGDLHRFRRLRKFLDMDARGWKSLEGFAISHTAMMNEFFKQCPTKENFEKLSVSRRYASGYCGAGQLSIKFLASNPGIIRCRQQFPKNHQSNPRRTDDNLTLRMMTASLTHAAHLSRTGSMFAMRMSMVVTTTTLVILTKTTLDLPKPTNPPNW